jgi:hypothetical protein
MYQVLYLVFPATIWVTLLITGFMFLRFAPLDPHNPVQLPSQWLQGCRSLVAATAMTIAPLLDGKPALIAASFAVGTILSAGLIDPFKLQRAAEPSRFARFMLDTLHRWSGSFLVKGLAFVVSWVSSWIWAPLWLPLLAWFAGLSVICRAGVLVNRSRIPEQVKADLQEAFPNGIPPALPNGTADVIMKMSNRAIRRSFGDNPLGSKLILSKSREYYIQWVATGIGDGAAFVPATGGRRGDRFRIAGNVTSSSDGLVTTGWWESS